MSKITNMKPKMIKSPFRPNLSCYFSIPGVHSVPALLRSLLCSNMAGTSCSFSLEHSFIYLLGSLPHPLQASSQVFQWSILLLSTAIYLSLDSISSLDNFWCHLNLQTYYYLIFVFLSSFLSHKNGGCTHERNLCCSQTSRSVCRIEYMVSVQ